MSRLPRIRHFTQDTQGRGYYLCARKERRLTRSGEPWVLVTLQDVTGEIPAKLFPPDSERYAAQFDAGEFVLVDGRVSAYGGRPELVLSAIRRVDPGQDRANGFREEECVPAAPRPVEEMWQELTARIAAMEDTGLRLLVARIAADHAAQLRVWPAAITVHHAYRGGLLEHVLQVARVGDALAATYGADADLVLAGAVLHDIGKLREIDYDVVPSYSRAGNLVGHIGQGLQLVREAASGVSTLSADRLGEVEHIIASHHGTREHGAIVEPRTVEAFIVAAADDLDAKVHQVRRHIAEDEGEGEFTAYHPRLKRSLLKPPTRR